MVASAALLVSSLIAACGPHSTDTLTIYQDAPTLKPLDLGQPGNSAGAAYYFSAPLHSSGPVTGQVFGSKTLVKVAAQANPNSEKRATLLFFTFGDGQDQIVAFGAGDYPPTAAEFNAGQHVVRAVLGGTGKRMGARSQLTSTRNADGSYTQVFTFVR